MQPALDLPSSNLFLLHCDVADAAKLACLLSEHSIGLDLHDAFWLQLAQGVFGPTKTVLVLNYAHVDAWYPHYFLGPYDAKTFKPSSRSRLMQDNQQRYYVGWLPDERSRSALNRLTCTTVDPLFAASTPVDPGEDQSQQAALDKRRFKTRGG